MATLTEVSSLITGLGTLGLGFYHQVATGGQAPLPAAPLPNNALTASNQRGSGIFSGGSTWIILLGAGVALLVVVMLMRKKK